MSNKARMYGVKSRPPPYGPNPAPTPIPVSRWSRFWRELRRRHVFKVGSAYLMAAWILAQVTSVVTPFLNLPNWIGAMVIVLLMLGLPIALILAWAFELTPTGIRRTADLPVDGKPPANPVSGRRLDFIIIGLLGVALTYLLADKFWLVHTAPSSAATPARALAPAKSIAVLPFLALDGDKDGEHFADGLAEELFSRLVQIPGLKVAGRASSYSFKDKHQDLREVGRKLGVTTVLEGSVRRAGSRLRITAQLVNTTDGFQLWATSYDRGTTDIFAIQDEIAGAVANALSVELSGPGGKPAAHGTTNPEAQILYLRALGLFKSRSAAGLAEARKLLEQATALDPGFAQAYAMLAIIEDKWFNYGDTASYKDALSHGRAWAEKARALEPNLAELALAEGMLARLAFNNEPTAELGARMITELERATAARPGDGETWYQLGASQVALSRLDAGQRSLEHAIALEPLVPIYRSTLLEVLAWRNDWDAYGKALADMRQLFPGERLTFSSAAKLTLHEGRLAETVAQYRECFQQTRSNRCLGYWGWFYWLLGETGRAQGVFAAIGDKKDKESLLKRFFASVNAGHLAELEAASKARDPAQGQAFDSFEEQLAWLYLGQGRNREAVAEFRAASPSLFTTPEPYLSRSSFEFALGTALALKRSNDPAYGRWLAALEALRQRAPELANEAWAPGRVDIALAALRGDSAAAVAALKRALARGFRSVGPLERDLFGQAAPLYSELQAVPEWSALLAELKTRNRNELDQAQAAGAALLP